MPAVCCNLYSVVMRAICTLYAPCLMIYDKPGTLQAVSCIAVCRTLCAVVCVRLSAQGGRRERAVERMGGTYAKPAGMTYQVPGISCMLSTRAPHGCRMAAPMLRVGRGRSSNCCLRHKQKNEIERNAKSFIRNLCFGRCAVQQYIKMMEK